jgi:hypothetical protein
LHEIASSRWLGARLFLLLLLFFLTFFLLVQEWHVSERMSGISSAFGTGSIPMGHGPTEPLHLGTGKQLELTSRSLEEEELVRLG